MSGAISFALSFADQNGQPAILRVSVEEETPTSVKVMDGLTTAAFVALLIIGCFAVTGYMNGIVAGGCILAVAGFAFLTQLVSNIAQPKCAKSFDIILTIFVGIMGALALAGVVTPAVAGWCAMVPCMIIGVVVIPTLLVACCVGSCFCAAALCGRNG